MDYRKLIKFGNSSYVVSLPKYWTEKNNLKKGDVIYLEENGNNELVLTKDKSHIKIPFKKILIDISRKDNKPIQREIASAYVGNYKEIVIIGNNLNDRADFIRETLHNFIALEIVEQTNERIIARDFLNINKIEIGSLIKRMDVILRSMFFDIKSSFKNKNIVEDMYRRDRDINRLTFLVYRICKYYMAFPHLLSHKKETINFYLKNWCIAENLEKLGDELKRITKIISYEVTEKELEEKLINLFAEIERFYSNALKAYYDYDVQLACALDQVNRLLTAKLGNDKLWEKATLKQNLLVEKLHNVIELVHRIAKVVSYV